MGRSTHGGSCSDATNASSSPWDGKRAAEALLQTINARDQSQPEAFVCCLSIPASREVRELAAQWVGAAKTGREPGNSRRRGGRNRWVADAIPWRWNVWSLVRKCVLALWRNVPVRGPGREDRMQRLRLAHRPSPHHREIIADPAGAGIGGTPSSFAGGELRMCVAVPTGNLASRCARLFGMSSSEDSSHNR